MREYETTFIVQPEISDEGAQAILAKLDDTLEKAGDTRLYLEDSGKRKLAYEIRKFHKGHYYTLAYLGEGKSVPELERALRLDESVLRFLTILADERVKDVDARKAAAAEFEVDQARRAEEKAAREAEEQKAREEAQREADAAAAERAAAEAASAEAAAEAAAGEDTDPSGDAAPSDDAAAAEPSAEAVTEAEPSAEEAPAAEASEGDAEEPVKPEGGGA